MPVPSRILLSTSLAVAMLAACNSSPRAGAGSSAHDGAEAVNAPANRVSTEEIARLSRRAQTALATVVPGAGAARYANVRGGAAGAICGEVELVPGSFHPFLVTADGVGMVSASPTVRMDDPDDLFPDLYMQYCASVEELRRLGESMKGVAPARVPPPDPLPILPGDGGDDAAVGDIPADAREPARRGDDESFYNSVMRAPRSAAPRR